MGALRLTSVGVFFGLILGGYIALAGRTAYLQTVVRKDIQAKAERQQQMRETLPARRGSVFDATGQLLAGSVQVDIAFVDPRFMLQQYELRTEGADQLNTDITRLAEVLGLNPFDLRQTIVEKSSQRYVEIKRHLTSDVAQQVRRLRLPGVGVGKANERRYPMGTLAAHVIGAVGTDGQGLEGVELRYDKTLAGQNGTRRAVRDAARRSVSTAAEDYVPPVHGRHVVLTIDSRIQLIAERELKATARFFGASSAQVVVLDPRTGAVVALANYPSYNPQTIGLSTAEQRTNAALVLPYEPGSTIKPYIVARALETGSTRLNQVWPINSKTWRTDYGRTIEDVFHYGPLSTWDVIVRSSNIGMSMIAAAMGQPRLHEALTLFGFGKTTGIDLPGEGAGALRPLNRLTRHSTESLAQGYELLITPLQMVEAMCIVANGGQRVRPYVLEGVLREDGLLEQITQREAPLRVLSEQTAADMLRVMADTPVRGTARNARSDVYNLFGKTGTAHRAVDGRYNSTNYVASFVGGAPYEDPRLVIALVVRDPQRSLSHFGGIVAAPAAGRILRQSLEALGVPPSPQLPLPPETVIATLNRFDPKAYEKRSVETVLGQVD